ncbi:MAG: hypothetical protein OD815_000294 [Candidatus Alkanophagales archaeon MCA70_species_2]|nr:hypothetical protein [Candidatus Alkanophaga liquidiphilum]
MKITFSKHALQKIKEGKIKVEMVEEIRRKEGIRWVRM